MITRQDVAKRANVSVTTVSNVLQNKRYVDPDKTKRVLKAAEELNYFPNMVARSLASNKSMSIAIMMYDIENTYYNNVLKSIIVNADKEGYSVTVFNLRKDLPSQVNSIGERRFDAIINLSSLEYSPETYAKFLKMNSALINFSIEEGSIVYNDYVAGMKEVMSYLQKMNHRNVAYITSFSKEETLLQDIRTDFFLKNTDKYGFKLDNNYIYKTDDTVTSQHEIGYKGLKSVLQYDKSISAVLCINDNVAIGALKACHDMNIKVPDELSIIGCDDLDVCTYLIPSLSSISTNQATYGAEIIKATINLIKTGIKTYSANAAKFIIRDSCGLNKK